MLAAILGLLVWRRRGGEAFRDALDVAGGRAVRMLPRVLMMVLVASFVVRLLPQGIVGEYIGPESGFQGVLLAMLVGAMIPAGASTSFSVVILLNEAGAGTVQLITLLTAWSVFALHRVIIYEIPLMGWRFSVTRLAASLPLPLIAAGLTALLLMIFPLGPTPATL